MYSATRSDTSTGGRPPSFFAPKYEPSTFPTDNLAAMMKNHMLLFPSRTKIIKSPLVNPEHRPNSDKGWHTNEPTTTLG